MQGDKSPALKRFMDAAIGQDAQPPKQTEAVITSMVGKIGKIRGNVIFIADTSPEALQAVLARRSDSKSGD